LRALPGHYYCGNHINKQPHGIVAEAEAPQPEEQEQPGGKGAGMAPAVPAIPKVLTDK